MQLLVKNKRDYTFIFWYNPARDWSYPRRCCRYGDLQNIIEGESIRHAAQ